MEFAYKKVMVIDDTQIDRYIAERVIKRYSFAEEVINVESGLKALDYLKTHSGAPDELPRLVFLDINMPEMNGFEFLEAYNQLPDIIKNTCIIMMLTTSLNEMDRQQAECNPFVHSFLNKPLSEQKLAELRQLSA